MEQDTAAKWYYYQNGSSVGPLSQQDLMRLLEDKTISPNSYVWQEGMTKWCQASEIWRRDTFSPDPVRPAVETLGSIPRDYDRLKKVPVIFVIFFALLTLSIYIPVWFLMRRSALNAMQSREKIGRMFFIFVIVLYSIDGILYLVSTTLPWGIYPDLMLGMAVYKIYLCIHLIIGIMIIYQGFKVRQIILDHAQSCYGYTMKFNRFLTFFFVIYYLQFKINQLLSE